VEKLLQQVVGGNEVVSNVRSKDERMIVLDRRLEEMIPNIIDWSRI
jgi:hypothetical protein